MASDIKKVLDWIKKGEGFLIYLGVPGCGKTHFTHALLNYLKKQHRKFYVRRWNEYELLSRIRKEMPMEGDYIDSLKYWTDDDCVILDDMGSSNVNDWRKEIMLKFIDLRYESKKPTVITSNFTKEEISLNYGNRCYSRLFCDETVLLDFGSTDWRRVEKEQEKAAEE